MIRPSVFCAALALAILPVAFAQEKPASVLTLQECVDRALNKNFDLQIQRFSTLNARDNVIEADAGYDPTLLVSGSAAGSKDTNASPTSTSRQDQARLAVTQKIVTGASLTASTALDRSRVSPYTAPPFYNPVYNSDVSLSIRQPLLQGAGVTINRAAIARAKLGVTLANYNFKSVVLNVVRNVEGAYYNLAFAREQLKVYQFSLEVAQKLLDENESRRKTGVATDLEVLQSQVGVANANRNILLAKQTVRDSEDALTQLIGQFEFNSPVGTVRLSDDPVPGVSFDHSYALALVNQPDYAAGKVFAEQLKLDAAVAKNNRLPSLDLGGAVGYNSKDSDSYGSAAGNAWSGDSYNWQVDLTLTLPWGLRAERARYREALSTLSQQESALRQLDQSILVQVRSAVRSVDTNRETVKISGLSTQLSEKQFEFEKARYEAGLSTFRFVQQSQADLDTARVNELQARVNLRLSLADLARLEGSSLDRYKIKLED
ncbi:MAG TPA: TolC family protein [Rariglobus sp.]|jgi:outer membrane protein TolC|nr:TolC family protein [Rariglobus sp.]